MKTYRIETLGCKVNHYESQSLEEIFQKGGYQKVEEGQASDVTVVNTCTVTNLSDKKSRQAIRQAKRRSPQGLVVAMGCYSQVKPEEVAELEEVDLVLGTAHKGQILEEINRLKKERATPIEVEDMLDFGLFEDLHIHDQGAMTRAYMKVQDGCNQFCSYCIIPYARGRIRSRKMDQALEEARDLVASGYKEIVLTGIHIGSYGKDLEGDLGLIDLIEAMAKVEGLERIRLSSIEPMTISRDFLQRALDTGKLCDHFHLSLQSGSDTTLEAMNRKYRTEDYKRTVDLIREYMPHAGITTDIIVGFPGEEEVHFKETLDFAKEIGFARIHVFPYSPRTGTPAAARKDQVHGQVKKDRAKVLAQLAEDLQRDFVKREMPYRQSILFEEKIQDRVYGYTSNYIRVYAQTNKDLNNQVFYGKIKEEGLEPVEVIPWEG
ncbi:MAG: tRNA (N(6)-L-threonylcarbamoyladenosine(37)-C(2))-methylthiotransferase MtaB [Tissierellia bacterium]|nr:tRNA (N(6)-L-threonylcarbamoyladenosine(37)-C(2))-methylthiotransferase MtaB [Tissierellia bacterium]